AQKGIEVNTDTTALNEIESVVLGKKQSLLFLGLRHTANNIQKELFLPSLSERGSRNTWIKKGAFDIIDKAEKKVQKILKNHKKVLLEPELEKKIDRFIKNVEIRNINEYSN
ncbi:MAG: trimethylamine methyltransferase family protein, partial [Candidatus Thorarchaeota archaeon]